MYIFHIYNSGVIENFTKTNCKAFFIKNYLKVLSHTVGSVMRDYYGEEVQETAQLILKCDKFFDCLNSRSFTEHLVKLKPDLAPYRAINDQRFQVSLTVL